MTSAAFPHMRPDHDVTLHMHSGRPQPVRTRRVGAQADYSPRDAITLPLRAIGRDDLPPSLLSAHDGLHLHPAVVAAAAHATCELVAARVGETVPGSDEGLYDRLPRGRRALGAPNARWTEMALHRIEWIVRFAQRITGGTRVHGLVRWVTTPNVLDPRPIDENTVSVVLIHHLLLAYSTPPICTLRRAPSLEYYRESGLMVVRNFGEFEIDPSEGR